MSEFNPNDLPAPSWGTYIPARKPAWKIHRSVGMAASAVLCHLYRWRDGRLVDTSGCVWFYCSLRKEWFEIELPDEKPKSMSAYLTKKAEEVTNG